MINQQRRTDLSRSDESQEIRVKSIYYVFERGFGWVKVGQEEHQFTEEFIEPLSENDEWETPKELFDELCKTYKLYPDTDIAATTENSKCSWCLVKELDSLKLDWKYNDFIRTVWCNPPHSKTKQFVLKAHEQWLRHNINIMMLVPCGVISRKYFRRIWDCFVQTKLGVEVHPVDRPSFIHPDQEKREQARQDYIVIIWRARED